jgi:hypothetical protein
LSENLLIDLFPRFFYRAMGLGIAPRATKLQLKDAKLDFSPVV